MVVLENCVWQWVQCSVEGKKIDNKKKGNNLWIVLKKQAMWVDKAFIARADKEQKGEGPPSFSQHWEFAG